MATEVKGKYYDVYDFINVVEMLSHSQGFYGRLLERIEYMEIYEPEAFYELKEVVEEQKFKDPLDVVLFIEQG